MTVLETIKAQIEAKKAEIATLEAELAKAESWLGVEWDHIKNFVENVWGKL